MKILLDKNKPFFKGNLHSHSVYSDGAYTVEQLKEEYKKHGYSVVAFTDHEHLIDNSRLNDSEFLTITSCEVAIKEFETISTLKKFDMRVCHLNFYALDPHNTLTPCYSSVYDHYVSEQVKPLISYDKEYKREYSAKGINDIINTANSQGFLVSYNHPTWSLENATDYLAYENLFAVEVYNHACCLGGRLDDEHAFDDMLRSGKKVFCLAGDDNHNLNGFDGEVCESFGGWVQINAERLDYTAIMQALKNGDFYASTGPEIYSLTLDGDTVTIETSPCESVFLTTDNRRTSAVHCTKNNLVTTATFKLNEQDKFFRIRAIDEKGKKALSQAYFVK